MTIRSHPSQSSLLGYASGSLSPALSLALAAHLKLCPVCRDCVAAYEAEGGAHLDALPPSAMSSGALSRVLERLHEREEPASPQKPASVFDGLDLPEAVRAQSIGKRKTLAPGIWMASIMEDRRTGGQALLLGVKAGRKLPAHGHRGLEMTCVLTGSFSDASGTYGPGDFLEMDVDGEHQPVSGDSECVCLIANEAPPRFHNLAFWVIGALANWRPA